MNRKIITSKNTTAFYFPEEDFKSLRSELDKIGVLRRYTLTWRVNRYIMKLCLKDQEKQRLMKVFSDVKEPKKKETKIIRGFSGCLITGHKLRWK